MLIKSSHEKVCEALHDLPTHGADSSLLCFRFGGAMFVMQAPKLKKKFILLSYSIPQLQLPLPPLLSASPSLPDLPPLHCLLPEKSSPTRDINLVRL